VPDTRIEIGALNIVASPHPPNIYAQMLEAVADREVKLWGSDRGKITKPKRMEDKPGVLLGQVLLWAHIDPNSPWINTEKNVEATTEEKKAIVEALPGNIEPNFRAFNYAFVEEKHYLIIEIRNELGAHFSPNRVERMFSKLFEKLPKGFPATFDVTVVPEAESLKRILQIPRLQKLEIFLKRPNGDDLGDEYERILDEMKEEGAGSYKIEKKKAPKVKSMKLKEATVDLAEKASENGYVTGRGKSADGKTPIFESTKNHPKKRMMEVQTSSLGAFLSGLRHFV